MAGAVVNLCIDVCGFVAKNYKKSKMEGAVVNLCIYICGLIATKNLQCQVQLST
jgi:hypothetical protein